jgi:hypothetical protein
VELAEALRTAGTFRQLALNEVVVLSRTSSGRVARLRLRGDSTTDISAESFRLAVGRKLGWTKIRSDAYQVTDSGDSVVFVGRGSGHGVGLCQSGAAVMGEEGHDYREILRTYYPGTSVGLTSAGLHWQTMSDSRIELRTTRPEIDGSIMAAAEKSLRVTEQKAGWSLQTRPKVQVFPTVASYRDSTGEPGWVAASTRGHVIRMQPAESLRRLTTPEAVLEHEFMHLLVESKSSEKTPLWLREGLVLALSGEASSTSVNLSDRQVEQMLRTPASQDQLRNAYRQAAARVSQLVRRFGKDTVVSWLSTGVPGDSVRDGAR